MRSTKFPLFLAALCRYLAKRKRRPKFCAPEPVEICTAQQPWSVLGRLKAVSFAKEHANLVYCKPFDTARSAQSCG